MAAFLLTAGAILGWLFWQTNEVLTDQVLSAVSSEASEFRHIFDKGGIDAMSATVQARSRPEGPGLYLVADANGVKRAGNLSRIPPELADAAINGGVFTYEAADAGDAKSQRLGVAMLVRMEKGYITVVGRDIEEQRTFARRVRRVFLFGFGLLALTGLLGGLGAGRLLLGRIERINSTSRSIMEGDLSRRIPLEGSGDEIDGLSENLNAMLDRIVQLMNGMREVSDNIAHDLKTPLNRLRNRAEGALRDPRGCEAYREGLEKTIEEADELIKTFNALLLIARLEAGALEENMTEFDLAALVSDVAELYEPVAEEAGLPFTVDACTAPMVRANRQLIGQAVANLIDNAIKYGRTAKDRQNLTISVTVVAANGKAEIVVADRGPGISAEDRERALKRFVRLEKSRTQPGTGLGLSLVAAVARLHGGAVRLEDNAPGLRAVLTLPLASGAERDHAGSPLS